MTLADEMIELPRIDYDRCAGRPYRFVWGVGRTLGGDFLDSIVRIDVASRAARDLVRRGLLSRRAGIRAEPGASEEGEGVLLSVVLDARRGISFLLVLDAHSLAEIARAECPHHIPFGFHGHYFPSTLARCCICTADVAGTGCVDTNTSGAANRLEGRRPGDGRYGKGDTHRELQHYWCRFSALDAGNGLLRRQWPRRRSPKSSSTH